MIDFLNRKELAALLDRSPGYVSAMKRAGFTEFMPGRFRFSDAMTWLKAHPEFRTTDAYPSKKWKRKERLSTADQMQALNESVFNAIMKPRNT